MYYIVQTATTQNTFKLHTLTIRRLQTASPLHFALVRKVALPFRHKRLRADGLRLIQAPAGRAARVLVAWQRHIRRRALGGQHLSVLILRMLAIVAQQLTHGEIAHIIRRVILNRTNVGRQIGIGVRIEAIDGVVIVGADGALLIGDRYVFGIDEVHVEGVVLGVDLVFVVIDGG